MNPRLIILVGFMFLFTFGLTSLAQVKFDDSENDDDFEFSDEIIDEHRFIFDGSLYDFLNIFSEKYCVSFINTCSFDTEDVYLNIRLYKKIVYENPECNPDFIELEDFLYTLLENFGFYYEYIDDVYYIKKQVKEEVIVTESFIIPKEIEFRNIAMQFNSLIDRRTDKIVYNEETRLIFFVGSEKSFNTINNFYEKIVNILNERTKKDNEDNLTIMLKTRVTYIDDKGMQEEIDNYDISAIIKELESEEKNLYDFEVPSELLRKATFDEVKGWNVENLKKAAPKSKYIILIDMTSEFTNTIIYGKKEVYEAKTKFTINIIEVNTGIVSTLDSDAISIEKSKSHMSDIKTALNSSFNKSVKIVAANLSKWLN